MNKTLRVKLTFIEEVLGTASANPELHSEYIASKAPDAATREEEIEAIGTEAAIEKGMTVFPRNKAGEPIFWPYQVQGFFKSAQKTLNMFYGKNAKTYLTAYKSKIDQGVFVKSADGEWGAHERGIVIHTPRNTQIGDCERPLRAETPQGPRVALAHSESVPEGSWVEFDITVLDEKLLDNVREWLDYGCFNGIGQWRNSGKGRFTWEEISCS